MVKSCWREQYHCGFEGEGIVDHRKEHYREYNWMPQEDISLLSAKQLEDEGEYVDDIQVDGQGGKDVLLWA